MRALIVGNHFLIRKYLEAILLEDCGLLEVKKARNRTEALALIAAEQFDFVVIDIDMPRREGLLISPGVIPRSLLRRLQ